MYAARSASSGGGFAPRASSSHPCAEPPGRGLAAEKDVWGQELLASTHLPLPSSWSLQETVSLASSY